MELTFTIIEAKDASSINLKNTTTGATSTSISTIAIVDGADRYTYTPDNGSTDWDAFDSSVGLTISLSDFVNEADDDDPFGGSDGSYIMTITANVEESSATVIYLYANIEDCIVTNIKNFDWKDFYCKDCLCNKYPFVWKLHNLFLSLQMSAEQELTDNFDAILTALTTLCNNCTNGVIGDLGCGC